MVMNSQSLEDVLAGYTSTNSVWKNTVQEGVVAEILKLFFVLFQHLTTFVLKVQTMRYRPRIT